MTKTILCLGLWCASAALVGCGDTDDPPENPITPQGALEIKGAWAGSFGGTETITDDTWLAEGEFDGEPFQFEQGIVSYLNDENEVVTSSGDPVTYNRIVWTEIENDSFYYCTTDFGLASAADAEARNTTADASDPDNGGCGDSNFPWTQLTRQ